MRTILSVLAIALLSVPAAQALWHPTLNSAFGGPPSPGATLTFECRAGAAPCSFGYVEWPFFQNRFTFHATSCPESSVESCTPFSGRIVFRAVADDVNVGARTSDAWSIGFVDGVWWNGPVLVEGDGMISSYGFEPSIEVVPINAGVTVLGQPVVLPPPAYAVGNPGGDWHAWWTVREWTG